LIAPILGGYQGISSLLDLLFFAVDGRYPLNVWLLFLAFMICWNSRYNAALSFFTSYSASKISFSRLSSARISRFLFASAEMLSRQN
jgi:hypothetical protein